MTVWLRRRGRRFVSYVSAIVGGSYKLEDENTLLLESGGDLELEA